MKEEITKFFNDCKNSIDELNEQCGTLEDIINILQKAQKMVIQYTLLEMVVQVQLHLILYLIC